MNPERAGRSLTVVAIRQSVQSFVQRVLPWSKTRRGRDGESNDATTTANSNSTTASPSTSEPEEASYHGLLHIVEQQQQQHAGHPHHNSLVRMLHLHLDASVPLLDLAERIQVNPRLEAVHATVDASFAGRVLSELLLFWDAIGSRPQLQWLMLLHHRPAELPIQGLSLALLQAQRLRVLHLRSLSLTGTTSDFLTLGASLQQHLGLEEVTVARCSCRRMGVVQQGSTTTINMSTEQTSTSTDDTLQNDSQGEGQGDYTFDPVVRALSTIPNLQSVTLDATTYYNQQGHPSIEQAQQEGTLGNVYADTLGSLCRNNSLKTVSLTGFALTPDHLHTMADGLAASTTVTEVWLGTCQIKSSSNNNSGDASLARMIRQNASITYLDVTLEALAHVVDTAHALADNATLRHFLVHGRDISSNSQQAFADVLASSNCVLETMEFMDDSTEGGINEELAFYTTLNRQLNRQRLLANVQDTNLWVQALLSQIDHLSALFYLLSHNPILCSWTT